MTYAIELDNFAKILCGYFLQIITWFFIYIFFFHLGFGLEFGCLTTVRVEAHHKIRI